MPLFSVAELLNIAIKDEETGIAFYDTLAEASDNPKLTESIKAISRQEAMHAERFRTMLRRVGDYRPQERYEGEYESYLQAILELRAFPSPERAVQEARKAANNREALALAMRYEKDTLIFLNEIKKFLPSPQGEYVDEVIKEEREHLVELTRLQKTFL